MAYVQRAAALLFIIAVPVALLLTNIRLAANEPRVYEYAIDHYGGVEASGIARPELLRGSAGLRDYFRNDDGRIFVRVTQDGQSVSLFNDRETQHLRDVKTVFGGAFRVQEAAVVFALAYVVAVFIWARESNLRVLASQIAIAGIVGIAVIVALAVVALTGFDSAFERFHTVLFTNDLWQLDPDRDHLIQMFPEAFWRDISLWIGLATLVELGVLVAGAAVYLRFTREPAAPELIFKGAQA